MPSFAASFPKPSATREATGHDPVPHRKKKVRLATIDCETDPFAEARYRVKRDGKVTMERGEAPSALKPFSIGFYCDAFYRDFWGDDCIERMMEFLEGLPDEYLIFAHNGGKFDFGYFFRWVDNPVVIIGGRLVRARLFHHWIQDSFRLLPFSLATYAKTEIDYAKFKRAVREQHRAEIALYQKSDCENLYKLIAAFFERFGYALTIGRIGIDLLIERHPFPKMHPNSDIYFRDFYFGGRVECFKTGVIDGPFSVDDVNSMYPFVMAERRHPVGNAWDCRRQLPDNFDRPYFAKIIAASAGALPLVNPDTGGLDFPHGTFAFNACSHEIEMGLRHGILKIERVIECYVTRATITFDEFVHEFYQGKIAAKAEGDKIGELFVKYLLNTPYGKFGQNPANYRDYKIVRRLANGDREIDERELRAGAWELKADNPEWELWHKPAAITGAAYYDVSIAASITSAARAVLLEAIQHAVDPIYCDTDSLISRALAVRSHDADLGAWKHEFDCDRAAIAGKKLYALYNIDGRPLTAKLPVKVVSKGGTLTRDDIIELCEGGEVEFTNPVPTFRYDQKAVFITRTFRSTNRKTK
jgi:hypothetical protein